MKAKTKAAENPARTPSETDASTEYSASDESTQGLSEASKTPQNQSRWVDWKRFSRFIKFDPEAVEDGRFKDITYESVDTYTMGYPRWAAYQNSDPTFRIYKRYGTLRNRVILHRQQELSSLEAQLRILDEQDDQHQNFKTRSLTLDQADTGSERTRLIDQIDDKLKQYDELLAREHRSGLMQKPSRRDFRSLINYIWNSKPVVQTEAEFLRYRDDFVQLSERSESPLENIIDYIICNWIPIRWIRQQFSSEAQIVKTNDKFTTLPSPRKVFILARLVATAWAIVLISVPLSILASGIFNERTKLIVLMVSLLAFPVLIQVAARPRTLELFVATATYCAVLTTLLATSSTFSLSQLQSQLSFSFASNTAPT